MGVSATMDERRGRFEAQVMPHLDAAYRFARWLCRSADDADDLVQDAVLRAFRGFDTLRGSNVKAWLLTIVRNCHATSLKQRRGNLVPIPDDDDLQGGPALMADGPGPESLAIASDQQRSLDQIMRMLPDEYREILILREIEDLDYREIAQVTCVPMGTVMSRLARARAALKKQWLLQMEGQTHVAP
jgi:RNA polymerase sigma factor (sigma-70 family)